MESLHTGNYYFYLFFSFWVLFALWSFEFFVCLRLLNKSRSFLRASDRSASRGLFCCLYTMFFSFCPTTPRGWQPLPVTAAVSTTHACYSAGGRRRPQPRHGFVERGFTGLVIAVPSAGLITQFPLRLVVQLPFSRSGVIDRRI